MAKQDGLRYHYDTADARSLHVGSIQDTTYDAIDVPVSVTYEAWGCS
jgi:hypothetical protein